MKIYNCYESEHNISLSLFMFPILTHYARVNTWSTAWKLQILTDRRHMASATWPREYSVKRLSHMSLCTIVWYFFLYFTDLYWFYLVLSLHYQLPQPIGNTVLDNVCDVTVITCQEEKCSAAHNYRLFWSYNPIHLCPQHPINI